jgi:hypothetical protein
MEVAFVEFAAIAPVDGGALGSGWRSCPPD